MESDATFRLFGPDHIGALALGAATAAGLIAWVRRQPEAAGSIAIGFWLVLLTNKITQLWMAASNGSLGWHNGLPLHLCDVSLLIVLVVVALRGPQWAYELCYFWGLTGTVQALLTPDLPVRFPHYLFITFFISHLGIVVGVFYATLGLGLRPAPGGHWRAWCALWGYAAVVSLINWGGDLNYGYLCRKPAGASLLDHLGPWPVYVLATFAIAWIHFWVLDLPFRIGNARRTHEPNTED